ncbi:acetyltransferase [Klebsiella pneumoniae]|uniref:Acetyltransferase n=1 Tax=Klebsiella pneumoniae TaxID=573 RepID=A0A2X1SFB9_KLEPN|nr:acetyltransferase [Klebsiella pneumoniae]
MKFMECAVRDVIYGTNVRLVKPVNIYECELRDNVFVGPSLRYRKAVSLVVEVGYSRTRLFVRT